MRGKPLAGAQLQKFVIVGVFVYFIPFPPNAVYSHGTISNGFASSAHAGQETINCERAGGLGDSSRMCGGGGGAEFVNSSQNIVCITNHLIVLWGGQRQRRRRQCYFKVRTTMKLFLNRDLSRRRRRSVALVNQRIAYTFLVLCASIIIARLAISWGFCDGWALQKKWGCG